MNNGFFSFPDNLTNKNVLNIQEFDQSGSFIIPNGAKRLWVLAIGAGGGGAGGRRSAAGTAAFGGGGGGGGTIVLMEYLVEELGTPGSTIYVTIGAGGDGGAAATGDSSNGGNGSGGGATLLAIGGNENYFIVASGGNGTTGASATTAAGATGKNSWVYGLFLSIIGTAHGAGSAGSSGTPTSSAIYHFRDNGGAGGGGVDNGTPGTASQGGSIVAGGLFSGILNSFYTRGNNLVNQGVVGGNAGSATEQGGKTIIGRYSPGVGGGGGGGGASVNAGNGGNGYRGGGGGGGGGSRNGFSSGIGGRGGNGYVAIAAF